MNEETSGATVKVRSFTVLRDVFGADVIEVDVASPRTVQGVFDALFAKYDGALRAVIWDPESGQMTPFLIRLNDEIISSTFDMHRPVRSGDEIAIIFPIGGG
ncbi:MAG: MoaD/ThiS family protein [Chloroflexota bacterium]